MHEYTETDSKYIGEIGTHSVGINVNNNLKLKIMPREARLKIFDI